MMKTCKRALAVLCALACLFSCMSLAVSAEGDIQTVRIGYDNTATDTSSVMYDANSNTLTMRASRKLRLICQGDLPENTTVTWSSDDEDVVTIADDGTVTTGKKCEFAILKWQLPLRTILPMEIPYLPIPGGKGTATIKMTATDAAGNAVVKDVKLVVEHSLIGLIRYWIGI